MVESIDYISGELGKKLSGALQIEASENIRTSAAHHILCFYINHFSNTSTYLFLITSSTPPSCFLQTGLLQSFQNKSNLIFVLFLYFSYLSTT